MALQCYEEQMSSGCFIIDSGLVINPRWPWLGASPDGLVLQDGETVGAVEIKCPYSKRDMPISEACAERSFFLEMKSLSPSLKEKHAYHYQCQGVMNILGLKWLDFIVYTKRTFIGKDLTVIKSYGLTKCCQVLPISLLSLSCLVCSSVLNFCEGYHTV